MDNFITCYACACGKTVSAYDQKVGEYLLDPTVNLDEEHSDACDVTIRSLKMNTIAEYTEEFTVIHNGLDPKFPNPGVKSKMVLKCNCGDINRIKSKLYKNTIDIDNRELEILYRVVMYYSMV